MIYLDGNDMASGFNKIVEATLAGNLPEALKVGGRKPEVVSSDELEGIQGALEYMKKEISGRSLLLSVGIRFLYSGDRSGGVFSVWSRCVLKSLRNGLD
jgi:hypothetical protein